jgi:predicted nucleotidyltransferase
MSAKNINDNEEIAGIVNTILSIVPALEIYLFGSVANGTAKEDSDYDFYVVLPDDGIRAREATWRIQSAIKNRSRGIDMLVNTKSRFDKYKNSISFIESVIVRTGVKLYG